MNLVRVLVVAIVFSVNANAHSRVLTPEDCSKNGGAYECEHGVLFYCERDNPERNLASHRCGSDPDSVCTRTWEDGEDWITVGFQEWSKPFFQAESDAWSASGYCARYTRRVGATDAQLQQYLKLVYPLADCSHVPGASKIVDQAEETIWCAKEVVKCPHGFVLNGDVCEAYCSEGSIWNDTLLTCLPEPEHESCRTQTAQPIDLIRGRKYRSEFIIGSGGPAAVNLHYYYTNHGNSESTAGGLFAPAGVPRRLVATRAPVGLSEFQNQFNDKGLANSSKAVHVDQHYGSVEQYWRHSFDDVLLLQGEQFLFSTAKGQRIIFPALGFSDAYPTLLLEVLPEGQEAFSGYVLTDLSRSIKRIFDDFGKLRKIVHGDETQVLTYDDQTRLLSVVNRKGQFLKFEYQELSTETAYSLGSSTHYFPSRVISSSGSAVDLEWKESHRGVTARFHMLTFIGDPHESDGSSGRRFSYNDARWRVSLTDVHYEGRTSNAPQAYAHFEYDDHGQAIYSGLVNGIDAVRVEYPNEYTRIVTNALGKKATYQFADFDGVRRLKSVTGEPTQNCVRSEVEYVYDASGNVEREVKNGVVIAYRYDDKNRQIERTEAVGTPEARTITTEYHPSLNKPLKITEPGKITTMTYDAGGRMISMTTQSTAAP